MDPERKPLLPCSSSGDFVESLSSHTPTLQTQQTHLTHCCSYRGRTVRADCCCHRDVEHQHQEQHHESTPTTWHSAWREVASCFCAVLATFSMGLSMGFSSPALAQMERASLFTESEASWFGSLLNIGAILGGPLAGLLVERIGRKACIMTCALPYVLGWLLIAATVNPYVLYTGRALTGLGAGMSCLCVPLYIAEVAEKQRRGMLGAAIQIGSTSGILIINLLGLRFTWRWLAVLAAVPPTIMVILLLLTPESPRWLLTRPSHRAEALHVLFWLRNSKENSRKVTEECDEIEKAIEDEKCWGQVKWTQLVMDKSLLRPLIMSCTLMILQQFCGINAVIFYSQSIFQASGYSGAAAGVPPVIMSAVKVTCTFVMVAMIDRTGRLPLFMLGGVGMTISCLLLGIFFYLVDALHYSASSYSWMSLTGLIAYIIAFSVGWGAVPWLVMSEIFPTRAKGRASGLASVVNWSCSFVVTKSFQPMKAVLGAYTVFWGFAAVCVIGTVYAGFCVIETKGKSLEQIQQELKYERRGCASRIL